MPIEPSSHHSRRDTLRLGAAAGLAAAAVGVVSSLLLAGLVNRLGIQWMPPGRVEPALVSIGLGGEYLLILSTAAVLVLLACVSSLVPAARASRMNIVDALRHA